MGEFIHLGLLAAAPDVASLALPACTLKALALALAEGAPLRAEAEAARVGFGV